MSATLIQQVCPSWCTTTAAEHADDDPGALNHEGPMIAAGITAMQTEGQPLQGYLAQCEGPISVEELRALARACEQAAAWIEAQR